MWQAETPNAYAGIQNKYIWALDANNNLVLANAVPPFPWQYMAYVYYNTPNSVFPQIFQASWVLNSINAGQSIATVKGCIDPVTGKLTLNAAGRTNILFSGWEMWLSYDIGSDLGSRGINLQMFPTVTS